MEHERYLAEEIFRGPVFVTNYPRDIKPFYMRQNADCDGFVALVRPGNGTTAL